MSGRLISAILFAATLSSATPALSAGEIIITQAKVLAGNVTPGDAPGFPVTLSYPSSYQLGITLTLSALEHGIHITSPNVTLDLNGFTLNGANKGFHGIVGAQPNATIRNGTIAGFNGDGIHATGNYWTVEDLKVLSNDRDGISIQGDQARIRNSTASGNGEDGIVCIAYCLAEGNVMAENGARGIFLGVSGIALHNIAVENGGDGIQSSSTVISGNQVSNNSGAGILGGAVVQGNSIHNNAEHGISGVPVQSGYGNNRLYNNGYMIGGVEAVNVVPLHPNVCAPDACP